MKTEISAEECMPDWESLTPESAAKDLDRALEAADAAFAALEASSPTTYEDLVWRLDDATRPLWRKWSEVSHMLGVMNSEEWRKVEDEFRPRVVAFSLKAGQSRKVLGFAKELLGRGLGDATRTRILEKLVQSAELAGVGLDGECKTRFNEIQARLAKLAADFSNSVIDATNAFKYEKGGKTYTIDDACYPLTMKTCGDEEVRETLYRARVSRAPENAARIDEILALRAEVASLLGYASYADMSLASKCAPGVDSVMKTIDKLDVATQSAAERERLELQSGAGDPKPWDIAYLAERLRERKYQYSEEELKRYFELEVVLRGLFRLTAFLFGVDVVELTGNDKPSVWHDDVRFFAVKDGEETIAHFYFDPYVRSGLKQCGAWMNEFRNRRLAGISGGIVKPLAVIVTNFPKPDADGKTYLLMREVETLFHEFGHALQQMLTRIDEEDAAGINLVEWDAVEVASQFMENWCLDDRTGIEVPQEMKKRVRAAKNFRAAYACRRQLAFAKTDLMLHSGGCREKSPDEIKSENFSHFGVASIPGDRFLCAFTHIFAGGYAAGYYGYKWAEIMSADCFGAFEEAGLDDDNAVRSLGRRYRETILALGGSKSALDVFREFRGRDPEVSAILRQQDLV